MSWDHKRYNMVKYKYSGMLEAGTKNPYDLMQEYKKMIVKDDFEGAKALTDILLPLNYDTADTHSHIPQLNL